jgi:predicted MPP superfamily phosphohydrolase
VVFGIFVIFNMFLRRGTPTTLTLSEALLAGPFQWWLACSLVAFLLVVISKPFFVISRLLRSRTPETAKSLSQPGRRLFLARTGTAVLSAPFVAGVYGALYGRLNLEVASRRIHLPHLPKEFSGFRIAQLSDIHIGPFMPEDEIRRFVQIANERKADLIVVTGDYVTWDASTQQAVVEALSGLKAPFGILGCLGNHDAWTGVEDSITALFRSAGIRILRRENAAIVSGGSSLNVIGVDYESRRPARVSGNQHVVSGFLQGVDKLMVTNTANILLCHNPDAFDRAAELGIDLMMAGHTHGGQVALEFISPEIAPSRIVTPYVSGWFQKEGSQLYVNRGIGTIGAPIRLGAPPEITVYELV